MLNISTNDCKNYLITTFPETKASEWKRVSKYKDEKGQWCRDFSHTSLNPVTLVEIDGVLTQVDSNKNIPTTEIKDPSKVFYQLTFSKSETAKAKKLVKQFLEDGNEDEDSVVNEYQEGFEAIPSLVKFYVCENFEGNFQDIINTAIATKNYDIDANNLALYFYPIKDDSYDQHMSPLVLPFLPDYFGEAMECTFEITGSKGITIKDIFELLYSKGFIHDRKNCETKTLFKDYQIIPKQNELTPENKKTAPKKINYIQLFKKAVSTDNYVALESLIEKGLPIHLELNNYRPESLLAYCATNNKIECFKTLVKKTPNLGYEHKNNCDYIWSGHFTDQLKEMNPNFNFIEYILENGIFDFKGTNYGSSLQFVNTLIRNYKYFDRFKDKVDPLYLSHACLVDAICNQSIYNLPSVKIEANKAIDLYGSIITDNIMLTNRINAGKIIPEIMEKLIVRPDIKLNNNSLKDYLIFEINRYKNRSWPEEEARVSYYKEFLSRLY